MVLIYHLVLFFWSSIILTHIILICELDLSSSSIILEYRLDFFAVRLAVIVSSGALHQVRRLPQGAPRLAAGWFWGAQLMPSSSSIILLIYHLNLSSSWSIMLIFHLDLASWSIILIYHLKLSSWYIILICHNLYLSSSWYILLI